MPQLTFQVFFKSICDEPYTAEFLDKHLKIMETNSGFVICPGIPTLSSEVCFKPKKYRKWTLPFVRIMQVAMAQHRSSCEAC